MNDHDCGFAQAKQIVWTCFDPHTNGKTRREVHPVERPLNVWKSLGQTANSIGIRRNTKPDAIYYSFKALIRFG